MRLLAGLSVAIVLFGIVASGCSDSGSDSSVPVFREGDAILVDEGQEFVIALTANPSTGYSWQAAKNAKVEYLDSTQVSGSTQVVGSPGTQQLRFKAVASGETTLRLAYSRPFEAGVPPAETTSFDVTIEG